MGTEEQVDEALRRANAQLLEDIAYDVNQHILYLDENDPDLQLNIMKILSEANDLFYERVNVIKPCDDAELLVLMRAAHKIGYPHVTEAYSPPRATALAQTCGLRAGRAMDLTTVDERGIP